MADIVPKIGDIKNLKDLSRVIVLPMICACYLFQSDFSIDIDGLITLTFTDDVSTTQQFILAAIIFTAKTLWAAFWAILTYAFLLWANFTIHQAIIPIFVLMLLTMGFAGIFAKGEIPLLSELGSVWFYTSFVVGFFLLSIEEELDSIG